MSKKEGGKKTIGWLEHIDVLDFGLKSIVAKMDTGAYTGSLHVEDIKEVVLDGKRYVQFKLLDSSHPQYQNRIFQTDVFKEKKIKSSNGDIQHRYAVPLVIQLKGLELKIELSLSNRSDLKYPILLGRRVFRKHFIIDASKKFTHNK